MSAHRLEVDHPLGAGEVVATTIREYGRRPLTYVAIGALEALAGLTTYSGAGIPLAVGLVIVAFAFVLCFALTTVVSGGWSQAESIARLKNAGGVLILLAVIVGLPATLGRVDAIFTLVAILWLSIVGFSIPIVIREQTESVTLRGMMGALRRSVVFSQAAFLHAIGVVFILYLVTVLITSLLAAALGSFGDQGELAAFVIARAVLVPILFIGMTVLYLDQRGRLLGTPTPARV